MTLKNAFRLAVLCFATLPLVAQAQQPAPTSAKPNYTCSRAQTDPTKAQPLVNGDEERNYDVLSYKLHLDWRKIFSKKQPGYSGVNEIALKLKSADTEVMFDATLMSIDTVWIDGTRLTKTPQVNSSEELHIPLPTTLQAAGSETVIKIAYTHTGANEQGLYYYPKGQFVGMGPDPWKDSVFVAEDIAYTMSEPLDAHKWMPCSDVPHDKAESQISITVPSGVNAQSNGLLLSIDSNASDGSHTFNWKSDKPISTYLMVADASTFIEWGDTYTRISDGSAVPVRYYAWPADYYQDSVTNGRLYNAQRSFEKTPKMLKAFSERYGEYPFAKYSQVPVQPFYFGGMEHQTITTINRSWFRGWSETGIAHELMHQWFGDKTTCETWKDIWLNEGFASYGEAIWLESEYGPSNYLQTILDKTHGFFTTDKPWNEIPAYAPPLSAVFNWATTYAKGAITLHMLRRMLGDDTLFFGALRGYSAKFAYTSASTAQFIEYMTERTGRDLSEFFDQWIYQGGWPVYNVLWSQNHPDRIQIRVTQTQAERDHYTMPLRFVAHYEGGSADTITFNNNSRSQLEILGVRDNVSSLTWDTSSVPLAVDSIEYSSTALQVAANASSENAGLSVERIGDDLIARFASSDNSQTLTLSTILGARVVSTEVKPGKQSERIQITGLPTGSYIVSLLKSGRLLSRVVQFAR